MEHSHHAVNRRVLVRKDDNDHQFSQVVVSNHHIAQLSFVASLVVERDIVRYGIVSNGVAYLVLDIGHEMTFVYLQHFVEAIWNMESEGGFTKCFVFGIGF